MSAGYRPQDDDALQDAWAEQAQGERMRHAFDAWAVRAGFAYRDSAGRIWFHRNGGDGMWDAFSAGVHLAWRVNAPNRRQQSEPA